ncbi:hypothetical protein BH925_05030 [Rodentibacter pneumotropicus]|uniref:hypothetical protein n=1 Tax=Rodentibacter pneumotropicus TaxID=758 RepID=UPI000988AD0A|nr:hypothetical protein [Rodentibacter pneumotropicus]OOF65194.1 hypothetical protein BH925_05030 [Rodentibacter pneumotropicus]
MNEVFQRWTERATDGTGDLFLIGNSEDFLSYKDDRKSHLGRFVLSVFNVSRDDFDLYQEFNTKQGWKNAYRLARVIIKHRNRREQ